MTEDEEFELLERRIARQSIGVTHDAVDIVRPVDDAQRNESRSTQSSVPSSSTERSFT
jgi:hypothetical protein